MKRKTSPLGCLLLLALSSISGTVSLKCHSCSDALDLHECKSTEICDEGQVCYKRRQFTRQVQFDLGCIDKEECGRYANASGNAKMSADQSSYCYECCSKDGCNKNLCEYPPHSLCKDDESVDCAKLNSMFSICELINQAKKICPKFCNLCNLVDGNWSPWSSWSSCDVTCGKGSLIRHRVCSNPAPQNGGLDCPGKSTESKKCKLEPCPVHGGWSSWDNWGKCSSTCGTGMRSRKRSCTNPRPQRFGDHCFGDSIEDELCTDRSCAVNGSWSDWSKWGQCSVSCAIGIQSRSRFCTNPTPTNAGKMWCTGQSLDVRQCNRKMCPGEWTTWQSWGKCSGLCGQNLQTRKRTCHKGMLTMDCQGNSTETRTCGDTKCYTDCKDIMKYNGKLDSGVYNVRLWQSNRTIPVYCDFDADNGGWTVFQYRFNGSVIFYRNFMEYERGFGSKHGEFWLGLRFIYEMVAQGKTELRLNLVAADGKNAYETFQNFRLGTSPHYTLYIDQGVGTAGDNQGLSYNKGHNFATYDKDNSNKCAHKDRGGWWYYNCAYANLNGEYVTPGTQRPVDGEAGMTYRSFKGFESLRVSKMMFRRV